MFRNIVNNIVARFHRRRISCRVSVLICLFASSSWLAIDGIFVELPLLVKRLPEEWQLPSYVAIIIQIANIGPLLYTVKTKIYPDKLKEIPVIFFLLSLGAISIVTLIFVWDETFIVHNKSISLTFFIAAFFVSVMSCTSSVTYYPYMSRFKQDYLTPFFIGQGLSGLLPSLFALTQGIDHSDPVCVFRNSTLLNTTSNVIEIIQNKTSEPNFSVAIYFLLLLIMLLISLFCFIGLNTLPIAKNEKIKHKKEIHRKEHLDKSIPSINSSVVVTWNKDDSLERLNSNVEFYPVNTDVPNERCVQSLVYQDTVEDGCSSLLTQKEIHVLLFTQAWINACSNGIFPSISSYAALPYGLNIFHLLVTLSMVADPVACLIHNWLPMTSVRKICSGSFIYTIFIGYFVLLALLSPCPYFTKGNIGGIVVIVVGVVSTGLVSYFRLAISSNLHTAGKKALLYMGISIQAGSSIGALIFFLLINSTSLFTQSKPCNEQCT